MQTLVTRFLLACEHDGLARTTVVSYRSLLGQFVRWAPTRVGDGLDPETLLRYKGALLASGKRPRSVNAALSAIRSLCHYATERGILAEDPSRRVRRVHNDMARRPVLTDADVAALFAACDKLRNRRRSALGRVLLAIYGCGGLRFEEARNLHVEDADFIERALIVRRGKGGRPRIVAVSDGTLEHLRQWLAVRGPCAHDWLLARNRHDRVNQAGVYSVLDDLACIAGIDAERCRPHALRHFMATSLMRQGANLLTVSRRLGHSDLKTTQDYLHLMEEDRREAAVLAERPMTPGVAPSRRPFSVWLGR